MKYYLQNCTQFFLHTKLNNHLLSMDCNVVSQLKMVGYGCTIEGMHYATHFGRRNTKFFSVKSYNITQQSSTFDGKQQNNVVYHQKRSIAVVRQRDCITQRNLGVVMKKLKLWRGFYRNNSDCHSIEKLTFRV